MMAIECNKCKTERAIDCFEARPGSKFGYRRTCKDCRRTAKNATNVRYYHRHKERILGELKAWRDANPEKVKLWKLRYYLKHRERKLTYNREYYCRNRERLKADAAERYRKDPEKKKLAQFRYYLLNRALILSKQREYYHHNRERLVAAQAMRRRRLAHRLDQGWSKGLPHDRIELEAQQRHWQEMKAVECVADLYEQLTSIEREYCEAFMADYIEAIPEHVLELIRSKVAR